MLELPDVPFLRILSLLPLSDEASLVRTCKAAQSRCRGHLHRVKRLFDETNDADKLAIVELFGRGSYDRLAREWAASETRPKRLRGLEKLGPPPLSFSPENDLLGLADCDYGVCERVADVALGNRPLCALHAAQFICHACAGAFIEDDMSTCITCWAQVCPRCVRASDSIAYCPRCAQSLTLDEHWKHLGDTDNK